MSQPPQGEDPQSPWARPPREPSGEPGPRPAAPGGHGPPGGWGPPSGAPGQPTQYQGWGGSPRYGQPGQYRQPAQHGQYGQSDGWGPPSAAPGGWGPPSGQQHGFPGGWGPPAPPARPPSRLPKLLGLVVLAVLLVGAALTLPSLLGSTRLDPAAVERAVAGQFEDREGVALDLTCDPELPVRDGATYSCVGRTADDEPITITITLSGEDGDYTWDAG